MKLFENKVIKNRLHFIKSFNEKEWWYSGIQFRIPDETDSKKTKTVFLGISEARSVFIDSLAVVYYDGKTVFPVPKKQKFKYAAGYYIKKNLTKTDGNSLLVNSKHLQFCYSENKKNDNETVYQMELKLNDPKNFSGCEIELKLELKPELPLFEKYDNYFENNYGLENYFLLIEKGTVKINGKEYTLSAKDKNIVYQDHCFGKVPRKTKWHWAAVWNKNFYLDSLVNYAAYPQKYTQIFAPKISKEWIRLDQNVSFECNDIENCFEKKWKITSTQFDLNMEISGTALEREAIPFLFCPFFINLFHYQCFVRVWGKVLLNGEWIETGDMFGVFEEHRGKW